MMRLFCLILLLPLFYSGLKADDQKEMEAVYRMFEAQRLPEQINHVIRSVAAQQLEHSPEMKQYGPAVTAFLEKSAGYSAIREDLARIFLRHFTLDDVEKITAFYRSPAGKKMAEQSSGIFNEMSLLIDAKLRQNLPVLTEQMKRIRAGNPQP